MTKTLRRRIVLLSLCTFAALGTWPIDLIGYVMNGPKWPTSEVRYYVNPDNVHVSDTAAIAAIQNGAAAWSEQSGANISLLYAGQTSGSSLTFNGKNEVFFRNTTKSGMNAETLWWYDYNNHITEFDVVFYTGSLKLFAGSAGCSSGLYIEDLATHEFGHALGLGHSRVDGATMEPAVAGYCDMNFRTLAPDDIAGIESIYPPLGGSRPVAPSQLNVVPSSSNPTSALVLTWSDNANDEDGYRVQRSPNGTDFTQIAQIGPNSEAYTNSGLTAGTTYYYRVLAYNEFGGSVSNVDSAQTQTSGSTNTSPSVTMSNPASGASYPEDVAISFTGSANDTEDGDLTPDMVWTSSLAGQIGTGGSFSRRLAAGTHTITARATDSGGLSGSRQRSMTVTVSTSTAAAPRLSVRGYKVKGDKRADLSWSGFSASSIDILRNGSRIATSSNDGSYTDTTFDDKGNGSATYKVCASGTSTCSNQATTGF